MSDEDKALVDRLRSLAEEWCEMCDDIHEPLGEAADRIEAQAAEIEKLREALEYYVDRNNPCPNEGPWGVDSTDFGLVALKALVETK